MNNKNLGVTMHCSILIGQSVSTRTHMNRWR